jgi:23S rRNA pseudouridine2605 synthase
MSNTPEFNAEQLTAARAAAWRQDEKAILTLEAARDFITANGLVLFTPRAEQIAAPAPSFVEATLGAQTSEPSADQVGSALALAGRLIAEGSALALNLFGAPGDIPDFIASTQAFSFLYTLRGDKNWKQPPATSGATKSSPLGIRVFEVLTEKGALSASELAGELGRELTEGAVQRSLSELWSNLRVLPLYGQSGPPVLWELATRRFTKTIKSGVNAGQPTALSALLSLYLGQALLATEEEIEAFLSPLAARSRIREVVHALTGSRQLEVVVLEGKSLLHIPGTLPAFPAAEMSAEDQPADELTELAAAATPKIEGEGRIKRFTPAAERTSARDFKGKPARPSSSGRPPARSSSRPDAERRPFRRDGAAKPAFEKSTRDRPAREKPSRPFSGKPSFSKPWEEDRKPRAPRGDREGFASKRPDFKRGPAEGAGKRPYTPRGESPSARPARPAFRPKSEAASTDKPFRKFDAPKRPFRREETGSDRPAPRTFRAGSDSPRTPRPYASGGSSARPPRPFRASSEAPRTPRPYASEGSSARPPRPFRASSEAPRTPRSFTPEASSPRPPRPSAPGGERSFDRAKSPSARPFPRKFDRPSEPEEQPKRPWQDAKPARGEKAAGGSFVRRPSASRPSPSGGSARPSFGAKRSFGDKPKPSFSRAGSGPRTSSGGAPKRKPAGGGTVPFGSKPPRGVNPRTANRKPFKRKPEQD